MRSASVLSAAALCLVSACADNVPVQPTTAALSAYSASAASSDDGEVAIVDVNLSRFVPDLGMPRPADAVIASVELLYDVQALEDAPATIILANDRTKLGPSAWVKNDPRRGGRAGLTWGYAAFNPAGVAIFEPTTGQLRLASPQELEDVVVEAMSAWTNRGCLKGPVTRIFPGASLPDMLTWGWLTSAQVPAFANLGILGITVTWNFPGDLDSNGRPDAAFREVFFNAHRVWSHNGPLNTIDLFSVVAHESGHAFGIGHFGKVFARAKDLPRIMAGEVDLIKYAPRAMMNAVYVSGRSEISGTDNASFCQISAGQL
jgi:hypothetical protein